ncbi:hypothetical protein LJC34_04960 [Oscillospiraceae bacterium OttesenSCG-928-G22]|nr:hypothetical protein [Oscillospiraceae bacterium OttesenSCG-928-G22]
MKQTHPKKRIVCALLAALMVAGLFGIGASADTEEVFDFAQYCADNAEHTPSEHLSDVLKTYLRLGTQETLPSGKEFEVIVSTALSEQAVGVLQNVRIDIDIPEGLEISRLPAYTVVEANPEDTGAGTRLTLDISKIGQSMSDIYSFFVTYPTGVTPDGKSADISITDYHWYEPVDSGSPFEGMPFASAVPPVPTDPDEARATVTVNAEASLAWHVLNHTATGAVHILSHTWGKGVDTETIAFSKSSAFTVTLEDSHAESTGRLNATGVYATSILTWDEGLSLTADSVKLSDGGTAELIAVDDPRFPAFTAPFLLITWQLPDSALTSDEPFVGTVTLEKATWTLAGGATFKEDEAYDAKIYHTVLSGDDYADGVYAETTVTLDGSAVTESIPFASGLATTKEIKVVKPKDATVPPTEPEPDLIAENFKKSNTGYKYSGNNTRYDTTNRPQLPKYTADSHRLVTFTLDKFSATQINKPLTGLEVYDIARGYIGVRNDTPKYTADSTDAAARANAYDVDAMSPVNLTTGVYAGMADATYTINVYYADGTIATKTPAFATSETHDLEDLYTGGESSVPRVIGVRYLYGDVSETFAVTTAPVLTYRVDPSEAVLKAANGGKPIKLGDTFAFKNEANIAYSVAGTLYEGASNTKVDYIILPAPTAKDYESKTTGLKTGLKAGEEILFTLTYQHAGDESASALRITDTVSGPGDYEVKDGKLRQVLQSIEVLRLDGSVEAFTSAEIATIVSNSPYTGDPDNETQVSWYITFDHTGTPATDKCLKDGESIILKFSAWIDPDIVVDRDIEIENKFSLKWLPESKAGAGGPGGGDNWKDGDGAEVVIPLKPYYPKIKITHKSVDATDNARTKIDKRLAESFTTEGDRLYFKTDVSNVESKTDDPLKRSVLVEVLPAYTKYVGTTYVKKGDVPLSVGVGSYSAYLLEDYAMADGSTRDVVVYVFDTDLAYRGPDDYDTFSVKYEYKYVLGGDSKPTVLTSGKDADGYVSMEGYAYFYPLTTTPEYRPFDIQENGGSRSSYLSNPATGELKSTNLILSIVEKTITDNDPLTTSIAVPDKTDAKGHTAYASDVLKLRSGVQRIDVYKYSMNESSGAFKKVDDGAVKATAPGGEIRYLLQLSNRSVEDVAIEAAYDILPPGVTADVNNLKITVHKSIQASDKPSDYSMTYTDLSGNTITKTLSPDDISVTSDMVTIDGVQRQRLTFRIKPQYSGGTPNPLPSPNNLTLHGASDTVCIQYSVKAASEDDYKKGGTFRSLFEGSQTGVSQDVYNDFGVVVSDKVARVAGAAPLTAATTQSLVWPASDTRYYPAGTHLITASSRTFFKVDAFALGIQKYHMELKGNTLVPVKTVQNYKVGMKVFWGIDVTLGKASKRDLENYVLFDILPSGFTYVAGSAKIDGTAIADPDTGYRFTDGRTLLVWKSGTLGDKATVKATGQDQTFRLTYETSTFGEDGLTGHHTNAAFLAVSDFLFPGKESTLFGSTVYLKSAADINKTVLSRLGITDSYSCIRATADIEISTSFGATVTKSITAGNTTVGGGQELGIKKGETFTYTIELKNTLYNANEFGGLQLADLFPMLKDRGIVRRASRNSMWVPEYAGAVKVTYTKRGGTETELEAEKYDVYLRPGTGTFAPLLYEENAKGFNQDGNNWVLAEDYDAQHPDTLPDAIFVDLHGLDKLYHGASVKLTFNMKAPAEPDIGTFGAVAWNSTAAKVDVVTTGNTSSYVAEPPPVGVRLSETALIVNKSVYGPLRESTFKFKLTGELDSGNGGPVTFDNGETELTFEIKVNDTSKAGSFSYNKPLPPGTYTLTELTDQLTVKPISIKFGDDVTTFVDNTATFRVTQDRLYTISVINAYERGGETTPSGTPTPSETPSASPSDSSQPSPSGTLVPQDDGSYVVVDEDGTPLGTWTQDEDGEWIYEELIPLGDLPQAGGILLPFVFILLGGALIFAGVWMKKSKRKDTEN